MKRPFVRKRPDVIQRLKDRKGKQERVIKCSLVGRLTEKRLLLFKGVKRCAHSFFQSNICCYKLHTNDMDLFIETHSCNDINVISKIA